MKRSNLFILLVFVVVTSCQQQDLDRKRAGGGTSNDPLLNSSSPSPVGTIVNGNNNDHSDDTANNSNKNTYIPSVVQHCSWSQNGVSGFSSSSSHLSPDEQNQSEGSYTLCQSKTNEAEVYLQTKNPIESSMLCLIPTYHSGSNSVYLGEPRCLYVQQTNTLYKILLLKNRPNFQNYPITGVMMMKDKVYFYQAPFNQYISSPDAYIFCSEWLAQTGDSSYCVPFRDSAHYVKHQF